MVNTHSSRVLCHNKDLPHQTSPKDPRLLPPEFPMQQSDLRVYARFVAHPDPMPRPMSKENRNLPQEVKKTELYFRNVRPQLIIRDPCDRLGMQCFVIDAHTGIRFCFG